MDRVDRMEEMLDEMEAMVKGPSVEGAKDYSKLFKEGEFNFIKMYEDFNTETLIEASENVVDSEEAQEVADDLIAKCREKLQFGVKKYGDSSFQAGLENCFKSPFFDHAMDEIIDLMNYLNHIVFVGQLFGMQLTDLATIRSFLSQLFPVYSFILTMKDVYTPDINKYLQ